MEKWAVKFLIGNKIDKPYWSVTTEEGKKAAADTGFSYFETSAVESVGV